MLGQSCCGISRGPALTSSPLRMRNSSNLNTTTVIDLNSKINAKIVHQLCCVLAVQQRMKSSKLILLWILDTAVTCVVKFFRYFSFKGALYVLSCKDSKQGQ